MLKEEPIATLFKAAYVQFNNELARSLYRLSSDFHDMCVCSEIGSPPESSSLFKAVEEVVDDIRLSKSHQSNVRSIVPNMF